MEQAGQGPTDHVQHGICSPVWSSQNGEEIIGLRVRSLGFQTLQVALGFIFGTIKKMTLVLKLWKLELSQGSLATKAQKENETHLCHRTGQVQAVMPTRLSCFSTCDGFLGFVEELIVTH